MAEQQAHITEPTEAVASGLVRLMLLMEALYSRQSRKAGLTAQQAQLLCTAARRKAGLGEIAEALHCDRSNVSRLLDRVTHRGLAHRAPDSRDGRRGRLTTRAWKSRATRAGQYQPAIDRMIHKAEQPPRLNLRSTRR